MRIVITLPPEIRLNGRRVLDIKNETYAPPVLGEILRPPRRRRRRRIRTDEKLSIGKTERWTAV